VEYVTGITLAHFLRGAERLGVKTGPIIAKHELESLAEAHPLTRYSGLLYEALLMDLLLASGDTLFGFRLGQRVIPGAYGVIGHLALGSTTIGAAIEVVAEYQGLVGNMGQLLVRKMPQGGQRVYWQMSHTNKAIRRHITENVLALSIQFLRLAVGRKEQTVSAVYLEHEPLSGELREQYEAFFACPIYYGSAKSYIEMSAEVCQLGINPYDSTIHDALKLQAEQQLQQVQQQEDLLGVVRQQLRHSLPSGASGRKQVAEQLGMSLRTLDRRLAEAGINWQQMLDSTRSRLAQEYLVTSSLSVEEISVRLGYTSARSLHRRFRQWTGFTPAAFRQAHQNTVP